ncbi:MAG: hypothetical protein KTR31_13130 [Myxococcales bacterium]|nr:hypothetical protein [Myxococcales bacterium]
MIWLLAAGSAHAAAPSWEALAAQSGWRDLGERRSAIGPVNVRTKKLDDAGCVEGRATVDVPVASMMALARDMVSAVDWSQADLAESREIRRSGPDEFLLYQYYDAPGWTFTADRYWVIRGRASSRDTGGRYRYERVDATLHPAAHDAAMARSSRAIEPPVNYGEWLFDSGPEGTTVLYRSCTDVGGRLPDRLVHWLNTNQVPNMIADFVEEAAER